jgi:catechol 2,3-dioxygenase-like lactoylglutathione lyase family enzyme
MAARLRHIAISVPDPEKAAKFFEEAFGMQVAGPAGLGLYVNRRHHQCCAAEIPRRRAGLFARLSRFDSLRHVG